MKAPAVTLIEGDARVKLGLLKPEAYHICVTSPPYFTLRDNSKCECSVERRYVSDYHPKGGGILQVRDKAPDPKCPKCKGTGKKPKVAEKQIGWENSPNEYVSNQLAVLKGIHRALRKDGTLWLNLADCFVKAKKKGQDFGVLKQKDLFGIPWRVAFAAQGLALISIDELAEVCEAIDSRNLPALDAFRAGLKLWEGFKEMEWLTLRRDNIWAKPNPLPEPGSGRSVSSHEYVFQFAKSSAYFYDAEAVRETALTSKWPGIGPKHGNTRKRDEHYEDMDVHKGRNQRSVWFVATASYPDFHTSTFPEEIPERCIKAGTSAKGACEKCGAPWKRAAEQDETPQGWKPTCRCFGAPTVQVKKCPECKGTGLQPEEAQVTLSEFTEEEEQPEGEPVEVEACDECDGDKTVEVEVWASNVIEPWPTEPCMVLDPFAGSGTTGAVARKLGRSATLIELNPEYCKSIRKRAQLDQQALGVQHGIAHG